MRIYLDDCSFNRPFDDQSRMKVKLEADAKLYLGKVEAERFISLIIREPFDYTNWQQDLWKDKTIKDISGAAMEYRTKMQA